jgi:hypothetical protein
MASSINASTSGAGGVITTADNTGILNLQTASTTAVTVDASQNVGIGTTSPSYKLEIGTTSDSSISANIKTSTTGTGNLFFSDTNNGQGGITYNHTSDYMRFLVNDTERMRIDSSGNVLVNQTANTYAGKVSFTHDSSIDDGLVIRDSRTTGGSTQVSFIYNTTQVGRIHTTSSATTYATSSDYRLKENVVPMVGALDKVALLKPVTYKWKADGSDGQGFIAHELQEVIPDCVSGQKDAVNEDGSIDPQGIDTSFLVATLTAAIQEQQTIINDLKARVTALENA